MELRHLRYFVAVAQEQHMTRAAARLGIQQPPLSQQIKALEDELGVQLFERAPRKILLNAAGRIFLQDARALLADADAAVLRVRQAARGELGRISVGYTNSASLHALAPRIIRAFRSAYPLVALAIEEDVTMPLLEALSAARLDLAFVRASSLRYPGLRSIVLCQEPMIVALPSGHDHRWPRWRAKIWCYTGAPTVPARWTP
jgi:DNA-binding transcriptional LysR family regulator